MKNKIAFQSSLLAVLMMGFLALPQQAQAQSELDPSCGNPDQNDIATHYSLYYEDYKNKNFESSIPHLRWMLKCAPGFPQNKDRNFERAWKTYKGLSDAASDAAVSQAYLDSALIIFDTAVPTIQSIDGEIDEWEWLFEKGRFIQQHPEQFSELQAEVGPIYEASYNMDHTRVTNYYIDFIIRDYINKGDKAGAVDYMDVVEENSADNQELMDIITQWRNALFTNPVERIEFLLTRLDKDPENVDLRTELFELYLDEEYREEAIEQAEILMDLNPTAEIYRLIGQMRLEDGENEEAIELFTQALDLPGGTEYARDLHYNMGVAEQNMGRLSRARTHYRHAIDVDGNFGKAYLEIANLYATAVQNCATFDREDRAVYWLVTDYYQRAKSVDPTAAATADRQIREFRKYYPTAEDKFFKKWETGDSYTVNQSPCYTWINETTRVKD